MLEQDLLSIGSARGSLSLNVGLGKVRPCGRSIATFYDGKCLTALNAVAGLDLKLQNATARWREDSENLCGICLDFAREI